MTRPGRRQVFMTAGMTASAAVLAMAVQAGFEGEPAGPSSGDPAAASSDADGPGEPGEPDASVEQ